MSILFGKIVVNKPFFPLLWQKLVSKTRNYIHICGHMSRVQDSTQGVFPLFKSPSVLSVSLPLDLPTPHLLVSRPMSSGERGRCRGG